MITIIVIFLAILIGACLPSLLWLFFFLREDLHPAPRRILIYIFGAGAISSLFILVAQFLFEEASRGRMDSTLFILLGLATIEEIFKFFSAYFALWKSPDFSEPMDGMVYAMTAALGFASIENIFALAGTAGTSDFLSLYNIGYLIVVRFLGATMLHALAAGIVGYFWAKASFQGPFWRQITIGLILATAVHTAFNYLVILYQDRNLLIYPALFLAVILFFVITDFEILRSDEVREDTLLAAKKM